MTSVFVTGATGFVGRNLVPYLRSRGDHVRCLVRKTASPTTVAELTALGAELVPGDVTDPGSLREAVQGVEVVYHVAGLTLSFDRQQFHRVNAEGPRLVAEACADLPRPPVLVSVSSLAAAGPSPFDRPRAEDQPPNPVSHYGRSKLQGEVALHRFADRVPITVVRPPGVFGPWDVHVLDVFRMVKRGWHLTPGLTPQRVALVSVADLVEFLPLAAERGRRLTPGEGPDLSFQGYYFVSHEEQPTFAELGRLFAEAMGRRAPLTLNAPHVVCWGAAGFVEVFGRLRGKPLLLNFDKVREATAGSWICRIDRARDELGFRPRAALREQLRDTARWYAEQRWL